MSQCSVYGLLRVICLMLFSGNSHLYLVRIPEHVILIMVLKLDLVLFKNISRSLSLEEGNKYNAFETLKLPGSWYCPLTYFKPGYQKVKNSTTCLIFFQTHLSVLLPNIPATKNPFLKAIICILISLRISDSLHLFRCPYITRQTL